MASFRQYKKDVTVEAKQAMVTSGMEQCKFHELMPVLINRMFNYKLEIDTMERDVFSLPERMPLVFN